MRKIVPDKDKYAVGGIGALKQKESAPRYPTIHIDHKHFPEGKKSIPGDMHHVEMQLKMVGNNQSRYDDSGEYEIHALGSKGKKKGNNLGAPSLNENPDDQTLEGKD